MRKANKMGPGSLHNSKQLSGSRTGAEMWEEDAELPGPSEQEIQQTSPKREV